MEERNKILIVDDNNENIRVLIEILKRDYQLNAATDGNRAVEIAKSWDPDLILLDVVMPGISGYDVCMSLRACDETKDIPVCFVTAISDDAEELSCVKVGAMDYVTKPIKPELLKAKIKNFVAVKNDRRLLSEIIRIKKENIDECLNLSHFVTLSSAEFRDSEIGKWHIKRCVELTKIMLKALISNINYAELAASNSAEAICNAVPYHDIGKAGLPDSLILKPDKLTPEEFDLMKTHVNISGDLIESISVGLDDERYVKTTLDMIKYHHERWDGTGYPDGLSGNSIPLPARIMAIVDQYETLISRRIYKDHSFHFEAVRIISSESGKGFDPDLVFEFLKVQDLFLKAVQEFAEPHEEEGFIKKILGDDNV